MVGSNTTILRFSVLWDDFRIVSFRSSKCATESAFVQTPILLGPAKVESSTS